jgi:nicotinate phosphoribosyltransferase
LRLLFDDERQRQLAYERSIALETDLYHVDASYVAWKSGQNGLATFDLYTRSAPFKGAFMLFAGLELAIDYLRNFRYSESDLAYLRSFGKYDEAFLDVLANLSFSGEVMSFEEGDIAFPNEPLLRITAPFAEALLIESGLLRAIGISTLIATKASRMSLVAQGAGLADFALRRAHEPFVAARSSYIGGFATTSFVDAARQLGIPATGTIPHALVQAYPDELTAFRAVAEVLPAYSLLLDTYDVPRGIEHAITVAREAKASHGHVLTAVRLDSGPLERGSRMIREALDAAGLHEVKVLVSGDIDEYRIQRLMTAGTPVDGFGVGGNLGVGLGTVESGTVGGVIGAVYKLAWYDDGTESGSRMKIAGGKSTLPGRKVPWRIGEFEQDIVQLEGEPAPERGRKLLVPVIANGEFVYREPALQEIAERAQASLATLPARWAELTCEEQYPVARSAALEALTASTRQHIAETNR